MHPFLGQRISSSGVQNVYRGGGHGWRKARLLALLLVLLPTWTAGQDANRCDEPGEAPDIVVGNLHQVKRFGSEGGITGFSVGTTSCNLGTCWANWQGDTNQHPVIAQNMFRLKDGRFEQVGQSWVKHGFLALSGSYCSPDCVSVPDGSHLGVNCSDPYSSGLNGDQSRLGPRSEINAATGAFPFPFSTQGVTGSLIFKRLQVHNTDLEPALNTGASYFVEGQYVTADDILGGNEANNNSYRPVNVTHTGGSFDISLSASTVQQAAAVQAWTAQDPEVHDASVKVPDDGLFLVYSRATELGGGVWHYEYAVQNLTSHRSAGSFEVPLPAGAQVQNIGFHDVDYHSGEAYDGTDWPGQVIATTGGDVVSWSTTRFSSNPDANALRWGTLYNFRFDTELPPITGNVTLGLFVPDLPDSVVAEARVPSLCNNDGICEGDETCTNCADCTVRWPPSGFCNDGLCEPGIGEDCLSCPEDCNGQQSGQPTGRFCCGDGDGEAPVGCGNMNCTSSGFSCGTSVVETCCGDNICHALETSCLCAADCGPPLALELACNDGSDDDCDGDTDCADSDCCDDTACVDGIDADGDGVADCDCDDTNDQVWASPGEARSLQLSHDGPGSAGLSWMPPMDMGSVTVTYDVLRSSGEDFLGSGECLTLPDSAFSAATDGDLPSPGTGFHYLVRALNGCPDPGTLGVKSTDEEREGLACP